MASDYASFSDQVLASMLHDAEKELFTLENTTPDPSQEQNYKIDVAFAKQNVVKLTEALKAKANKSLESSTFSVAQTPQPAEVGSHTEEPKQAPPSYSTATNNDITGETTDNGAELETSEVSINK